MEIVTKSGKTKKIITIQYPCPATLQEMVADLGEAVVYSLAKRMLKLDVRNGAAAKLDNEKNPSTPEAIVAFYEKEWKPGQPRVASGAAKLTKEERIKRDVAGMDAAQLQAMLAQIKEQLQAKRGSK